MNENQAERIALAFEKIANTIEAWYNASHPAPRQPREAIVTKTKSEEDQLLEDQGATGEETTEEWSNIGDRERDFIRSIDRGLRKIGSGSEK